MKKVMLSKSIRIFTPPTVSATNGAKKTPSKDTINKKVPEIYEQRKALKPAYMELFKALFKIPDPNVQKRVMDAINGVSSSNETDGCVECKKRSTEKREYRSEGTQTDDLLQNDPLARQTSGLKSYESSNPSPKSLESQDLQETSTIESPQLNRRKRKRKNCLPRVIKESQAQIVQQEKPFMSKRARPKTVEKKPLVNNQDSTMNHNKAKNLDTDHPVNSYINCDDFIDKKILEILLSDESLLFPKRTLNHDAIIPNHTLELISSEIMSDGYLPIHDAISRHEIYRLRRQIYIWKQIKKVNLNDILNEYDEDCLQVAITNDCPKAIIEIIYESGFDMNCIYEYSNNALHLAILNEIDLKSIIYLTEIIDLRMLLKTNDDGYTPLFLAVRMKQYFYAEAILDVIDERLKLKPYKRSQNYDQSEKCTVSEFTAYYKSKCEDLEKIRSELSREQFKAKQSVLNAVDPKSGNTMLLFSMEHAMEHFVYLFLAHLAHPLVPNLSGQNAKSYFGEYGRILKLNTAIENIIQTVISLLK